VVSDWAPCVTHSASRSRAGKDDGLALLGGWIWRGGGRRLRRRGDPGRLLCGVLVFRFWVLGLEREVWVEGGGVDVEDTDREGLCEGDGEGIEEEMDVVKR